MLSLTSEVCSVNLAPDSEAHFSVKSTVQVT